jgi:hypothetical protein
MVSLEALAVAIFVLIYVAIIFENVMVHRVAAAF